MSEGSTGRPVSGAGTPEHPVIAVNEPPAGLPPLVSTPAQLDNVLQRLDAGTGPVALDTERAGSYRYSDKAYLLQVHREGSGSFLIDPLPFGRLDALQDVIGDTTWIFHAVLADLPACRELGLEPAEVFDTELAARLLDLPNVGLGGVVEDLLGIRLRKAHSAADWSRRPIPVDWVRYAALDVEYLIPLRQRMLTELAAAGKLDIAEEEFAAQLLQTPRATKLHDWSRLHGAGALHQPAQRRIAHALWELRDEIAQQADLSPHRVYQDRAIVRAARERVRTSTRLAGILGLQARDPILERAWDALQGARAATGDAPLPHAIPYPPTRAWARSRPAAAARLQLARTDLRAMADQEHLPAENLLEPHVLKAVAWNLGEEHPGTDRLRDALRQEGARAWQIDRTAVVLAVAFAEADRVAASAARAA
jgi:ribonuclease D